MQIELLAIVETLKEFKGMLWGQPVKVYTDHKNLMRDALGLTSDRVYRWRLLLEEYGPEIVYIKGIHNTVADAISRLEYDPSVNKTAESYLMTKVKGNSRSVQRQNWLTLSKHWCKVDTDDTTKHEDLNLVFATHGEEDEIYPLTIIEIAEAQKKDRNLKIYYKRNAKTPEKGMSFQLIEDTKVLCKEDKLVIPASLQHRAVSWYHHYLQHPGHSRLEETLRSVMYWKGMRHTIRKYVKSCRSCQVNKRHSQKYGHVPPKGIKRKPTSVKNPQANAILERIHAVVMTMLRTAEIDMADSVKPSDIDVFLSDAAWAIRSTYHTVLKASPGAAIFGRDMLFDIPFIADWKKIGEHRQLLTDRNTARENEGRIDYDYQVGQKVLVRNDGILRKAESRYLREPWLITSVHTNGTIRVQCGNKSERMNIRRVKPFDDGTNI